MYERPQTAVSLHSIKGETLNIYLSMDVYTKNINIKYDLKAREKKEREIKIACTRSLAWVHAVMTPMHGEIFTF